MGRLPHPDKAKQDFWAKVEALEKSAGIPRRLAQQVVAGQITLNEAVQKLALQDRVDGLIRRHDISRALATQIALGHAELESVLRRQRMKQHKEINYTRSILDDAAADGRTLSFSLHGGRVAEGVVAKSDRYEIDLRFSDGAVERLHKLAIKYAYSGEDAKKLRKNMRTEPALKESPKAPITRPQDRYTCSDRRLFTYVDAHTPVKATLLEGEVFRGEVESMSRYEFILKLKGGVSVIIFRHALSDLTEE